MICNTLQIRKWFSEGEIPDVPEDAVETLRIHKADKSTLRGYSGYICVLIEYTLYVLVMCHSHFPAAFFLVSTIAYKVELKAV